MSVQQPQVKPAGKDAPKSTTLDWTLPTPFLNLLTSPTIQVVDNLVPLKPVRITSPVKKVAAPFIDALRAIPDAFTTNGALAHSTTASALVDLFFEFTPGITAANLYEGLRKAWNTDPEATLKIVFQARSIHEGKGIEEDFYRALAWIWDNHPRTLLANLHMIVQPTCARHRSQKRDQANAARKLQAGKDVLSIGDDGEVEGDVLPEYPPRPHGSFHDLVNILILAINGQFTASYLGPINAHHEALAPKQYNKAFRIDRARLKVSPTGTKRNRSGFKAVGKALIVGSQARAAAGVRAGEQDFWEQIWQCGTKMAKHNLLHKRLDKILTTDKKFQALYLTITDIFVNQIKADLDLLDKHNDYLALPAHLRDGPSPHLFGMSYAAKWIPTPAHGADRQLHLASALGLLLFPGVGVMEGRGLLQKKVLTPLRKATSVPEVEMKEGQWKIDYTKIPSRSLARNVKSFMLHDATGYQKYIDGVSKGRYTISGASLFPHEMLFDAVASGDSVKSQLADLQWKTLVDSIASSSANQLSNCMAIADVSASMGSYLQHSDKNRPRPISVCIALTLLLGEVSAPPWNGCFITFSTNPAIQFIDPSLPLSKRAATLSKANWTMTTNFTKVFNLILDTAINAKLAQKDMVKKLFVFSDMQFNAANGAKYGETEHMVIKRKYKEAGYEMPELVYWNLAVGYGGAGEKTKPVQAGEAGVALVSGWSGSLMKYFHGEEMDAEEEVKIGVIGVGSGNKGKDPLEHVMKIIGAESFRGLRVID